MAFYNECEWIILAPPAEALNNSGKTTAKSNQESKTNQSPTSTTSDDTLMTKPGQKSANDKSRSYEKTPVGIVADVLDEITKLSSSIPPLVRASTTGK